MTLQRRFAIGLGSLLFLVAVSAGYMAATQPESKGTKYVCSETNPGSMCTAATTCGSASSPCTVDIKRRGGSSATATPDIPNAKANAPFCVKVGTTVTFESSSKNTGFVLDFGPSSPFDTPNTPGTIIGGADRPISVVANKPGCYKYSVGACTPGTIYGMCGSAEAEIVVMSSN
jgi:plastocyanin